MPKGSNGHMGGFQLWVNLPSTHKMMEPRYREVNAASFNQRNMCSGTMIPSPSASLTVIAGPFPISSAWSFISMPGWSPPSFQTYFFLYSKNSMHGGFHVLQLPKYLNEHGAAPAIVQSLASYHVVTKRSELHIRGNWRSSPDAQHLRISSACCPDIDEHIISFNRFFHLFLSRRRKVLLRPRSFA